MASTSENRDVQSTPRKRKSEAAITPRSTSKGKKRAPPTPNPPLVPFPTPPATRHRKGDHVPLLADDAPSSLPASSIQVPSTNLPPHLQTLLTLHRSFNLALALHIATHPPVLPPHSSSTTKIPLPNLTNFLAIKETVERTSGRRFGLSELQRLAWVWRWDGEKLEEKEEENPFLVSSTPDTPMEVSGLSFLITPTRTLDATGRRVYTHGLGIELDLRPGETRQVLHGGSEGGLGNKGQGGGMGAIGRWSGGGDAREEVFVQRLEKWVEVHGGYEPPRADGTGLPTPSTSSSNRSTVPPIPLLTLPHLPSSTLLPSANLFSTTASASPGLSTPPKKPVPSGLSDPFDFKPAVTKPAAASGSVEERRQAMADRIKARSKKPLATLGSAVGGYSTKNLSSVALQEELKRRSTLSRLESVAEGVWMMFSAPTPGPSTLPTPPRGRRKAIPMAEAAEVIVKSSKTPISLAEAQTSLTMLCDLCPFFLTTKTVGRADWIEMPSAVAVAPPSPSSGALASVVALRPPPSPTSPGRPIKKAELAGPASPGRVRRQGGLREVRERIRRELGE